MRSFILYAFAWLFQLVASVIFGPGVQIKHGAIVRAKTRDIAFAYRMGAGFPGDINRTQPFSAYPGLINTSVQVPRAYGDPVLVDTATNSLRGYVAADQNATAAATYGFIVRPTPMQQASGGMSASIGAASPPASGVADFLRLGCIMAKLPAGVAVTKGGTVFVWCTATAGNNIQGQLVGAASAGNTIPLTNARFIGPADASGNVEVEVWAA
jgi:hypothetical protein